MSSVEKISAMHCYHTDSSPYELTLQIIYYHLSALGLKWEQIISGMCTIDWLLLQNKLPQLQWAKKPGNENLSGGAAEAHLELQFCWRCWGTNELFCEGRRKETAECMSFQKSRKTASGTKTKSQVVWSSS